MEDLRSLAACLATTTLSTVVGRSSIRHWNLRGWKRKRCLSICRLADPGSSSDIPRADGSARDVCLLTSGGQKTDGGARWIEWHDLEKLRYVLAPANFDVVLDLEFHDSDFNWFDLVRVSVACTTSKPQLHDKREERDRTPEFLARIEELQSQVVALQSSNEKQRQGLDSLNREKQQLERLWQATQKSAGWRLLNS